MPARRVMRLSAAVRVVDRVHGDAAALRPLALVPVAAGLADLHVLMLGVRNRADGRAALPAHHPDLRCRQPEADHRALLCDHLDRRTGGAAELAALAGGQLDVVHHGAGRDSRERKRVAGGDVGALAGDDLGPDPQPLRSQDVALLAVGVVEQRDARRAIWVVFDRGHLGGDPVLGALEVDLPVAPLGAAAAVAGGDATVGVAPTARVLALGELLGRLGAGELVADRIGPEATAGAGWFGLAIRHQIYPSTA